MALDLSKVKNRLESLKNTNTKAKHMWKPNKGKNVIRIIPYKFQVRQSVRGVAVPLQLLHQSEDLLVAVHVQPPGPNRRVVQQAQEDR